MLHFGEEKRKKEEEEGHGKPLKKPCDVFNLRNEKQMMTIRERVAREPVFCIFCFFAKKKQLSKRVR